MHKNAKSIHETELSYLIEEARQRSLVPDRSERDQAERTLRMLMLDPRATELNKLNMSVALVELAQRRGDHREALEQLDALGADEHPVARPGILYLRAISLTQLGECDDAAALFDTLLASPASVMDTSSGCWELEAGRTYSRARRMQDAIRVTRNAVSLFEKAKNEPINLTRAKSNLASFMLDSDDAEEVAEAENVLEATCDIKIANGDAEGASNNFSQLSMHHFARGNFEKAIAYGRKDLKLSRLIGDEHSIAATLNNMSRIYIGVSQLSEATTFASEAEEIGTRLNYPGIISNTAVLKRMIKDIGHSAGKSKIGIGKNAICACESGKKYVDCCGRADHEPVALRMPIGGSSEDIDDIKAALKATGLELLQLDFAMRETEESRSRIGWSEMKAHDGWFEAFELPDMANINLNAAEAFANRAVE